MNNNDKQSIRRIVENEVYPHIFTQPLWISKPGPSLTETLTAIKNRTEELYVLYPRDGSKELYILEVPVPGYSNEDIEITQSSTALFIKRKERNTVASSVTAIPVSGKYTDPLLTAITVPGVGSTKYEVVRACVAHGLLTANLTVRKPPSDVINITLG